MGEEIFPKTDVLIQRKAYPICTPRDLDTLLLDAERLFSGSPSYSLIKTSLIEFSLNGLKAIHKRIFFQEKNLSLSDDYEAGLKLFKSEYSKGLIFQSDRYTNFKNPPVLLEINSSPEGLLIEATTFAKMHESEFKRVTALLEGEMASQYAKNLLGKNHEAEGAGIGLLMLLQIMQKIKIPTDSLSFTAHEDRCVFRLRISSEHM
ncbi:hypothetical protein CH373_04890 [Leptospira perolatii]|uniref:Histidine kinase n=1 Tax=Leptospira perolatii TaxID=2023191 RepID=A0A2M9ZQM3_9LEPT|nr:hypothetical protein [Leptospira perolatii]PJZ70413.1 hypothetical protein CH360_05310 [Leptospira perolatii]PJZ74249.1 hypothetical protein CH373_04890 [Leptospira perolatii]